MNYYTLGHIFKELKKRNLNCSRPLFNSYEKAELVSPPNNELIYRQKPSLGSVTVRIYTEKEVEKIIKEIRKLNEKNA